MFSTLVWLYSFLFSRRTNIFVEVRISPMSLIFRVCIATVKNSNYSLKNETLRIQFTVKFFNTKINQENLRNLSITMAMSSQFWLILARTSSVGFLEGTQSNGRSRISSNKVDKYLTLDEGMLISLFFTFNFFDCTSSVKTVWK